MNRTAAERAWPGEDPIGKRFTFDGWKDRRITVVGVVDDVRSAGLENEIRPDVYMPLPQNMILVTGNVVIRTRGDPMSALPAVRAVVRALDPDMPLTRIATMGQRYGRALGHRRFNLLLIGIFAGLAFVLATVGIYGVMAYAVTLRTREIGIRMALGAERRDVLALVFRQGLALLLAGEALGLAGALACNRALSSMVFGIATTDPATYGAVTLAWAAVALCACWVPARRAARVDPMVALRYE